MQRKPTTLLHIPRQLQLSEKNMALSKATEGYKGTKDKEKTQHNNINNKHRVH
jgi:hypothetical protein